MGSAIFQADSEGSVQMHGCAGDLSTRWAHMTYVYFLYCGSFHTISKTRLFK